MTHSRISASTRIEKAARLISQGKVRPIQARSFVIEGDSGTYFVSVATEGPGGNVRDASCTCVFSRTAPIVKGDCSHVEAARAMLLAEQRAGWTQTTRQVSRTIRADMRVTYGKSETPASMTVRSVTDGAVLATFSGPLTQNGIGRAGAWLWDQVRGHGVIELICNPDGRERTDG